MVSENNALKPKPTLEQISLKELIFKVREWYNFILSQWPAILICCVGGCILGFTYSYLKKPVYVATTTFVLEESNSNTGGALGNLGGLVSMVGIDLAGGGGIFEGDNILQLYKSRTIIEKTLLTAVNNNGKKQLLVDLYIDFNKLRKKWGGKPQLENINFNNRLNGVGQEAGTIRLQDSILSIIVADINSRYLNVVKPDKKLSIFEVKVMSNDEFFSKAFNEEIVKNVNDFYVQTKTKKSTDNVNILQQKTDSVRSVMKGEIYKAAAIADATPNLNPTRQVQRIAPVQNSQFSAETNKAVLATLVQNLELAKIALRKETPLIQVLDRPILPLYKDKVGNLKGIAVGGVIGCILACFLLILRRTFTLMYLG